jgi:sortase A
MTPRQPANRSARSRLHAHRIRKWEHRDHQRALRKITPADPGTYLWGSVAVIGRGLIAAGVLLFGFVAYQLWGTGIETARAQRALANEFEQLLAEPAQPAPDSSSNSTSTSNSTSNSTKEDLAPQPAPEVKPPPQVSEVSLGEPIARLQIPRIDVDDIVVVGVGSSELQLGPGHFPDTVPPGHLGNAAIAGHRTTYGQPFRNVDRLQPGDEIRATTPEGTFTYRVTQTRIVSPSDYFVVFTTKPDEAQLTLVSCHPVWSTAQRIIVSASLVPEESSPVRQAQRYQVISQPGDPEPATDPAFAPEPTPEPATSQPATSQPGASQPATSQPAPPRADVGSTEPPTITDAFADGWFHDREAFPQIALWGALLILISALAYQISVLLRRDLVGCVVGVVPFGIALFYFFQNVNRLVPPGL